MKFIPPLLLSASIVSLSALAAAAQEDRFSNLIGQIDAVSDDALNIVPDQPPALVGRNCEVDDTRVEELDALLTLNTTDMAAAKATHAPWGMPISETANIAEEILHHPEYLINYNGNLKIPLYASYQLNSWDIRSRTRLNCFRQDVRVDDADSATLDDYDEPTFDRGHLVPRADMNRTEDAMLNTFVLSNMMPQHDNFNQGVWNTFESTVRAWTRDRGTVHIVTGAIFDKDAPLGDRDEDDDADRVRPLNQLGIPTHFYKIVLHERSSGYIDAIAILLPHTDDEVPKDTRKWEKLEWLEAHITSIDEIEAVSGYDFFPDMPDAQQVAVERSIAPGLWH